MQSYDYNCYGRGSSLILLFCGPTGHFSSKPKKCPVGFVAIVSTSLPRRSWWSIPTCRGSTFFQVNVQRPTRWKWRHWNIKGSEGIYVDLTSALLTTLGHIRDYRCIMDYGPRALEIEPGILTAYYWIIIAADETGNSTAREKFLRKAAEDLIDEENEKLLKLLALQNHISWSWRKICLP